MKKLFRFKYEPCLGTCYAPEDKFFEEMRSLTKDARVGIIDKLVDAHNSTCDDVNQLFAIDYDENNNIYIGTFFDNGRLDLISNESFVETVNILTQIVKERNKNKEASVGNCVYGLSGIEDLKRIIEKQTA